MQKESLDLHMMWHLDALLHIFPIVIVTTVDIEGSINAAPYALVLPFCSSPQNPQILLISSSMWHTAENTETTGEFVLNYPRAGQLKDIIQTSLFYPAGINELEYTDYTTMAARFVKPPRIVECYQHVECRVHTIVKPVELQCNIIADVLDISADAGLYALSRFARTRLVNAPVYLGVDEEQGHLYGTVCELTAEPVELKADVEKKWRTFPAVS
jgi:flavin reductase (DIM6/NTAB) family NADH-FMN oxidoreductase RutF